MPLSAVSNIISHRRFEASMPGLNGDGRRILSRGFTLWKEKEARDGHRISIDDIVAATHLSKGTVRQFVAVENSDITGRSISAAAIVADFLGTTIEKLITQVDVPEGSSRTAPVASGIREAA